MTDEYGFSGGFRQTAEIKMISVPTCCKVGSCAALNLLIIEEGIFCKCLTQIDWQRNFFMPLASARTKVGHRMNCIKQFARLTPSITVAVIEQQMSAECMPG